MDGSPDVLVGSPSATHGRSWENEPHNLQAVNRNHSEMVKFRKHDVIYDRVLVVLTRFLEASLRISVPRESPPKEAPYGYIPNYSGQ